MPAPKPFRLPSRRGPLRKQLQPDSQRLFYFSSLRALMAKAHASVTAELLPLVHEIAPRGDGLQVVRDSVDPRVRETVARLAKEFAPSVTPNRIKPLLAKVAQRTSDFQKAQLQAQVQQVLGVSPFIHDTSLATHTEAFTTENVALIKTIPERYFDGVEQVITDGVAAGSRASTIAAQIEERYQVSESNAARIANDQVGKLFGSLNETRQQELGVTGYIWRTVHDGRVRLEHRALDGSQQSWDDPPEGGGTDDSEPGHPGSGISCRCYAEPDFTGLLGDA